MPNCSHMLMVHTSVRISSAANLILGIEIENMKGTNKHVTDLYTLINSQLDRPTDCSIRVYQSCFAK